MIYMRDQKQEVLSIVHVRTGYGESLIASARSADIIEQMLKLDSIYLHGTLKTLSSDPDVSGRL